MDLNALPESEEEEELFEPTLSEDSAPEEKHSHHQYQQHVEHVETAVDIMRRVLLSLCLFIYFSCNFRVLDFW